MIVFVSAVVGVLALAEALREWRDPRGWSSRSSAFKPIARLGRRQPIVGGIGCVLAMLGYLAGMELFAGIVVSGSMLVWLGLWPEATDLEKDADQAEAVALMLERTRDLLEGGAERRQALRMAAQAAPEAIREPMNRFYLTSKYDIGAALDKLAREIDLPVVAMAVVGLKAAFSGEGSAVAPVIGRLAETADQDAKTWRRVHTARATVRSSAAMTVGAVLVGPIVLLATGSEVFVWYETSAGQVFLAGCLAAVAATYLLYLQIAHIDVPGRFGDSV